MLFAVIPFWFFVMGRNVMPERCLGRIRRYLRCVTRKPRKWYKCLEEREWFALLGGILFIAGVLMQFIAGS